MAHQKGGIDGGRAYDREIPDREQSHNRLTMPSKGVVSPFRRLYALVGLVLHPYRRSFFASEWIYKLYNGVEFITPHLKDSIGGMKNVNDRSDDVCKLPGVRGRAGQIWKRDQDRDQLP